MAKIKTDRAEAMVYNGRDAKFIKAVTDGPAYNRLVDQVIVEIDGTELYFFANEVILSDDEKKASTTDKKDALAAEREQLKRSKQEYDNKVKELAETKKPAEPEAPASEKK